MIKIYQVLSTLKYGDTIHKVGTFIESASAEYEALAKDKVLRVIEGAESIEHAAEIVAGELAEKSAADASTSAKAPEDTWAPKKPEAAAPEAPKAPETAPAGDNASGADVQTANGNKPADGAPADQQTGAPAAPAGENKAAAPNLDGGLDGDNL